MIFVLTSAIKNYVEVARLCEWELRGLLSKEEFAELQSLGNDMERLQDHFEVKERRLQPGEGCVIRLPAPSELGDEARAALSAAYLLQLR